MISLETVLASVGVPFNTLLCFNERIEVQGLLGVESSPILVLISVSFF